MAGKEQNFEVLSEKQKGKSMVYGYGKILHTSSEDSLNRSHFNKLNWMEHFLKHQ